MRIKVTQECIESGSKGSRSKSCPVAMAMSVAGLYSPSVGLSMSWWGRVRRDAATGRRFRSGCDIPPEVSEFIHRFDRGKSVEPFEFELEAD